MVVSTLIGLIITAPVYYLACKFPRFNKFILASLLIVLSYFIGQFILLAYVIVLARYI